MFFKVSALISSFSCRHSLRNLRDELFHGGGLYHKETSPLISSANHWFLYDRDLRLERINGFNVVVKSFFERLFLNSKVNFFDVIRLGRSEESVFFNLITKKKFTLKFQKSCFCVISLKKVIFHFFPT